MIETDLQAAPFNQVPGSYDYSVVEKIVITGVSSDFRSMIFNLTGLKEADLSGITEYHFLYIFNGTLSITTAKLPANINTIPYDMFFGYFRLNTLYLNGSAAPAMRWKRAAAARSG